MNNRFRFFIGDDEGIKKSIRYGGYKDGIYDIPSFYAALNKWYILR